MVLLGNVFRWEELLRRVGKKILHNRCCWLSASGFLSFTLCMYTSSFFLREKPGFSGHKTKLHVQKVQSLWRVEAPPTILALLNGKKSWWINSHLPFLLHGWLTSSPHTSPNCPQSDHIPGAHPGNLLHNMPCFTFLSFPTAFSNSPINTS